MGTMKTSAHIVCLHGCDQLYPVVFSFLTNGSTLLCQPIVLFSLDADPPMLLDRVYTSRPAAGMVFGVQSPRKQHSIPVTVNDEELSWNLLDPSAALMQSTLELLFGLLPSTVGLDSHGRVTESWLWAVGDDITTVINSGRVHVSKAAIATMLRQEYLGTFLNCNGCGHKSNLVLELSQE
jgi:hypothetical protein